MGVHALYMFQLFSPSLLRCRSKVEGKSEKQVDWCLRQLQQLACSQVQTNADMQKNVLSLFLRFAFFKCDGPIKGVEHVSPFCVLDALLFVFYYMICLDNVLKFLFFKFLFVCLSV